MLHYDCPHKDQESECNGCILVSRPRSVERLIPEESGWERSDEASRMTWSLVVPPACALIAPSAPSRTLGRVASAAGPLQTSNGYDYHCI